MTDTNIQLGCPAPHATMRIAWGLLLAIATASIGCAAPYEGPLAGMMARGAYGDARAHMQKVIVKQRRTTRGAGAIDRATVLNHMRHVIATLADGHVNGCENDVVTLFELLRLPGLNRDRTTAAVVLHEGVRLWKGEPFEQAMAYHYVALHYALRGQWGNVRAASDNALFHLRDFGVNIEGQEQSTADLIRNATDDPDYLERGYVAIPSDFAPAQPYVCDRRAAPGSPS